VRTLVTLAGAWGILALHAFHDHSWIALGAVSSAIAFTILVTAGWFGARRRDAARRAMSLGMVSAPLPLLLLSVSVAALAALAITSAAIPAPGQ